MCKALSRDFRIRVLNRSNHASNTSFNQGIGARGCSTVVRMWLQRKVGNCTLRAFARLLERIGFRMLELLVNVKTFSYNLALGTCDDAPDQRAGTNQSLPLIGQVESAPHHFRVKLSRSCAH